MLSHIAVWTLAMFLFFGVSLFSVPWWYAVPVASILTALLGGGAIYLWQTFQLRRQIAMTHSAIREFERQ